MVLVCFKIEANYDCPFLQDAKVEKAVAFPTRKTLFNGLLTEVALKRTVFWQKSSRLLGLVFEYYSLFDQ